jgi:hypothetical protein
MAFLSFCVLILALLFTPHARAHKTKDCGPVAPGTTFDENCQLVAVPPPLEGQGDATIVGKVKKVECTGKNKESRSYVATIEVTETIRGKVPSPVKIEFTQYNDQQTRLGDSGISFLQGDIAKLALTRYAGYWAVQFPFHKQVIQSGSGVLPACKN